MIRLLHLSDPHFGASDPTVAAAFLDHVKTLVPDYTILSGDLSMRARRREFTAAKAFVDALPKPLLLIPGNHDVPGVNHPVDRFFNSFRRYKKWFGKDLEPEVLTEKFHIVSTNSTRAFGLHIDWSEGILSKSQISRLTQRFLAAPAGCFKILVLHHPLLAPLGHGRTVVKPLPALLHAINEARIDLVLCGHFHQSHLATAGTLDGWKCVVSQASTVCSTRLQGEPQGFHEIQITEDNMLITPFKFERDRFLACSPLGFIRGASGWRDSETTQTEEVVSID